MRDAKSLRWEYVHTCSDPTTNFIKEVSKTIERDIFADLSIEIPIPLGVKEKFVKEFFRSLGYTAKQKTQNRYSNLIISL